MNIEYFLSISEILFMSMSRYYKKLVNIDFTNVTKFVKSMFTSSLEYLLIDISI